MPYSRSPHNKQKSSPKKAVILVIIAVLVIAATFVVLELTNTTHIFHSVRAKQGITASQSTKGETIAKPSPQVTKSQPQVTSTQPGDTKSETGGSPTATLITPTGNFVSAHRVPQSAAIASVCNTTPGATCKITFSANNQSLSLAPVVADRGGSAYWGSWTPTSVGLAVGTWKITAVASLNGQTLSSSDATEMTITP